MGAVHRGIAAHVGVGYHYTASQLITFKALESDTLHGNFGFTNDGVIEANGLELETEVRTKRGLQASASYVLQDTVDGRERAADQFAAAHGQGPRHHPDQGARVCVGGMAVHRGSLHAGRNAVGAVTVLHLTGGWPLGKTLVLTGSIRNLFGQAYLDPGSDEHLPDSIQQNGRTMRVGFRWAIGACDDETLAAMVLARARAAGLAMAVLAGIPWPAWRSRSPHRR